MTCTRRAYSFWTTCRCEKCLPVITRINKAAREGRIVRVPSARAWDRIKEWDRAGFEPKWIASACGIPYRGVSSAMTEWRATGHEREFGPKYSHIITSADISSATEGRCAAHGTRRRLQALAWMGWSGSAIQAETGVSFVTLAAIQRGATTTVGAPTYTAVRDAYLRLENARGPSNPSALRAQKFGWEPPAAWDDPDLDKPPARCGTESGYRAHTHRGDEHCAKCKKAHSQYRNRERKSAA